MASDHVDGPFVVCELCGLQVQTDGPRHDERDCELVITHRITDSGIAVINADAALRGALERHGAAKLALEVLRSRRARRAMGGPAGQRARQLFGEADA